MTTFMKPTASLAILTLAEPIVAAVNNAPNSTSPNQRNSNISASTENDDSATPASLEADLGHYKELFSKLRLTYLEQSSKERFLRSLLSSPPLIVSGTENNQLEGQLTSQKNVLQGRKEEVRLLIEAMGVRGRELAGRSEALRIQRDAVSKLPGEISALEGDVRMFREKQSGRNEGMGLGETKRVLEERKTEFEEVERRIAGLESLAERTGREAEDREREIADLDQRKGDVVREVREMGRGAGPIDREGRGLEERGRWERAREGVLRGLLEME